MVHPETSLRNLFNEVKLPPEWLETHFNQARIQQVSVYPKKRAWVIHLHLPEPIPAEVWHDFQLRIKKHFHPDIQVSVQFHYDRVEHEIVLQKYKYWIQKQIQDQVTPAAATWFGQAHWQVGDGQITVTFGNPAVLQMAKQRELDRYIAKYYQRVTGKEVGVRLMCRQEETSQNPIKEFQEQRAKEEQALIEQALAEQERKSGEIKEQDVEEKPVEKKIGYTIQQEPVPISSITEEEKSIVVKGKVFKSELRELKSGRKLLTFNLTDFTNSISCKLFARDKEQAAVLAQIKNGDWLKVRGSVQFDTFSRDLVLMVNDLMEIEPEERQDKAEEKRVELHLHTSMSAMDGVHDAGELIARAAKWGHPAIAITDHGVAQAFPEAYEAGKKHGIKVIFGMEANIVDDGVPIVTRPADRPLLEETYVVFDVETTGLSAVHDVIIELAAVKMKNGEIIDRFSEFANPHRPLTQQIIELTHITDDMLKDAPEIDDVITRFLDFIEGCVLVAHNARFDMGFLQEAVKRLGREPVQNTVLDTLELGRFLYPGMKNYRLNTLADKLNVKLEQHHRAIYDAEATGHILWKMLLDTVEKGITNLNQLNENTGDRDLTRLRPFHAILLVQNQVGLKNLYKMISMSHLNYFHRVPRIPRSELIKHREGLIIGSGCEKGELYEAALTKAPSQVEEIAQFYDYLEIQPVDINMHLVEKGIVESPERLREANRLLVEIGEKLGKPVVATANVHYLDEHDAIFRDILVSNQNGFRGGPLPKAHFRTTDEMLSEFSYLGEEKAKEVVITNPRKIAEQIETIQLLPEGTATPVIEGAEKELEEMCYKKAHEWYGDPLPEVVQKRLDRELTSIIKHGFAVIYLISQRLVTKSLADGYLVGSRGSVGSSFVATMSNITEVNPLPPHWRCPTCKHSEFILDGSYESGFDLPDKNCPKCGTKMKKDGHDIPFETFLGFEADKTPDIDLNFGSDYQPRAHAYTEELFGKDYIYRAGTIAKVQEKTAYGYVKKYQEHHNLHFRQAEIDRLVEGCTGVKRTTGQHPGGLMVIPQYKDVYDFTPIQYPADDAKSGTRTTHFDYRSISGKLLKLDILGHQDPTTIRMLQDLTGVNPQDIPMDDPEVLKLFSSTESLGVTPEQIGGVKTGTLGIPEFGTQFVRQMLEDTKPKTFSELVRISGLSHGTDVWLGNAQELIRSGTATLSETICCRDDIMLYLIYKGCPPKASFKIMEKVRKGKGVSEEEAELMRQHGVPEWYIESCRKIKYMFPRAHAAAYVMMAVRIAWFKVHYPIQYYATYFYRLLDDFDCEVVLKGPEFVKRRMKEIQEKGNAASPKEKGLFTALESVLEFFARGFTFKRVDLYRSHATQFVIDGDSLILPFASIPGVGENAANNIMEARKNGEFLSIEDFQKRARVSSTVVELLKNMGCLDGLPESNQLVLF